MIDCETILYSGLSCFLNGTDFFITISINHLQNKLCFLLFVVTINNQNISLDLITILQFHRILTLLAAAVCINGQFLSYDPHSTECALVLDGPGRSSSYDYNLNLFRDTL